MHNSQEALKQFKDYLHKIQEEVCAKIQKNQTPKTQVKESHNGRNAFKRGLRAKALTPAVNC